MMDACTRAAIRLEGDDEASRSFGHINRVSFFGIWDGHGGVDCATFASSHLHANALKAGLLKQKVRGSAYLVVVQE